MGAPVPFYRTLVWFLTLVELQPLPSLYPQEPDKKNHILRSDQSGGDDTLQKALISLLPLLYLPLQQSLMSQSLAGGLFPLIQLLLLLLYPAVETLQTPLPFCTSAMDLLSATNLMRESQTVDESWQA